MPTARCQSTALCIPDVGIAVLGGRNNPKCLATVEILVVASENGKIIFKWLKFPPMLRPRKSPLAAFANNSIFVAHPSAVYAEVEMFTLLKNQQWTIIKRSQQCKISFISTSMTSTGNRLILLGSFNTISNDANSTFKI